MTDVGPPNALNDNPFFRNSLSWLKQQPAFIKAWLDRQAAKRDDWNKRLTAWSDKQRQQRQQRPKTANYALLAKQSADWIAKNFPFASLILLLLSIILSMIFIVSYFSVFDFTLVWILEYSDITKLFLFLLSIIIIVCFGISMIFEGASERLLDRLILFFLIVLPAASLLALCNSVRLGGTWNVEGAFWGYVAINLVCLFQIITTLVHKDITRFGTAASLVILISVFVGSSGASYGLYLRLSPGQAIIEAKNGTYRNAYVIAWFSHHVAVYTRSEVVVIPTNDVLKYTSRATFSSSVSAR